MIEGVIYNTLKLIYFHMVAKTVCNSVAFMNYIIPIILAIWGDVVNNLG